MADLTVNETEAARVALEQVWHQLAPIVDEAKELQSDAAQNPSRLSDPWVNAHVSWLTVFDRDLAAVQAVYKAAGNGAKLSAEDIRPARDAGEKLLEIISLARERVPQHA
jgi:hypothetical protein